MKKEYVGAVVQAMVVSYLLTAVSMLMLAFLLYQFDLKEAPVRIGIIAIYGVASFIGGLFIGKKIKHREFLWGLIVGLIYYMLHVVVSIVLGGIMPQNLLPVISLALVCMGSGMLGGMLK